MWVCDRCGAASDGGSDQSPEGWDILSYGEKETKAADLCPA